jgi:hypothetical protein
MKHAKALGAALGLIALVGCGNTDSSHLVFGQDIVVGLTISASAPEQGGELTLGYKDRNIAVVPVAIKDETGKYISLGGYGQAPGEADLPSDAFSTLGQFEMRTGQDGTVSVGLGKFFATGIAAQNLSAGLAQTAQDTQDN